MTEFLLVLVIFLALTLLMLVGIPVGICMGVIGLIAGFLLWGHHIIDIIYSAFWNTMISWGLVVTPTFLFMSTILYRSGIADEMFEAFWKCLGHVRGSLAIISIMLGVVVGAMSAVAIAGIAVTTYLTYPLMIKYGYPKSLAIGSVIFAGSLPLIVPPSINMIMYSLQAGISIGYLFACGIGSSIVMAILGLMYVLIWSYVHKQKVPAVSVSYTLREKLISLKGLIPPLTIIAGTLGAIFTGAATPTEAGGIGCIITIIYTLIKRKLTKKLFIDAALETVRTMGSIAIIIIGGTAFGAVLTAIGGRRILLEFMTSFQPQWSFWIAQLIIIILGMFLDNLTICIVFAPLLAEPLVRLGFDPLWIGAVFMTTVMTELTSPPVGMSMFLFKALRPDVPMRDIYMSSLPFFGLMCLTVVVIILFPETVWLFVRVFAPK